MTRNGQAKSPRRCIIGKEDRAGRYKVQLFMQGKETVKHIAKIDPLQTGQRQGVIREFLQKSGKNKITSRMISEWENTIQDELLALEQPDFEDMKSFQPFPVDALPPLAKAFVSETAKSIDCDPSFVALPWLSITGAAIGNRAWVRATDDFAQPPMVWTCVVGKSGSAKSAPMKIAVDLLSGFEKPWRAEFEELSQQFEMDNERFKAELAIWKKKRGVFPDKPIKPIQKRILTTNATLEGLAAMLQGNPLGLLYYSDELAGWVNSFDQYRGSKGDLDAWLSMYDGQGFTHDRKTADSVRVESAFVGVTGGMQPGRMFDVFNREQQVAGLLSRILLAYPPHRTRSLSTESISPDIKTKVTSRLKRLVDIQPHEDDFDCRPHWVGIDEESFRIYKDFYDYTQQIVSYEDEPFSAAVSKISGIAARIALVLHLFERPADYKYPIESETTTNAITISEWFLNEAYRIYQNQFAGGDDQDSRILAAHIIEILQQSSSGLTVRDLQHKRRALRKHSADIVEQAVLALVSAKKVTKHIDRTAKTKISYSICENIVTGGR